MATQTSTPLSAVQLAAAIPQGTTEPAQVLALQQPYNAPQPGALELITNGLNLPPRVIDRLDSFPEEIYTLQNTDNLVRLLQVLLGPTGIGQARDRILQSRLAGVLQGANFYELDSFYGALFGLQRLSNEALVINPYTELGTYDQWSNVKISDAQYRSRIDAFGKAIALGPSALGMQLIAEAVLQQPCVIVEAWQLADQHPQTYGQLELLGTYSALEVFTYGQLESGSSPFSLLIGDNWDVNLGVLTPIGWWPLNEASGTTSVDQGTGRNNGAIQVTGGQPVLNQPSIIPELSDTCYDFGPSNVKAWVQVPEISAYEFGTTKSFSFGCWVQRAPWGGGGFPLTEMIFGKGVQTASGQTAGWLIEHNALGSFIFLSDGTNTTSASGASLANNGTHLAVATIDRTNQLLSWYVDGVWQDTVSISGIGSLTDATHGIGIGGDYLDSGYNIGFDVWHGWLGFIQTPFVVPGVLTQEQIAGLYASRQPAERKTFTVVPYKTITVADAFALKQVLDVLKPADSIANISTIGLDAQSEIVIRGVNADSSYWQMVENIIPNPVYADAYQVSSTPDANGFFEVLRAPFSEYQGEEIVYNYGITGVSAYNVDATGAVTAFNVGDAVTYLDGVTVYYVAADAIASRFFNLAGRLVQDGIMQASMYSADPTQVSPQQAAASTGTTVQPLGTSSPQTLYSDGMSLDALAQIIAEPGALSYLGAQPSQDDFWCTPDRTIDNPTIEVLETRWASPQLVNNIQFQAAHFPQIVTVETYDEANNVWDVVYTQTIYDSVPSSFSPTPGFPHVHPEHSAPNHWYQFDIDLNDVSTPRIRVLLQRNATGTGPALQTLAPNPPYTITTTPEPYSLAIKNLVFGFNVSQQADLPVEPIFTTDALGSQVEWTVRRELPNNAVNLASSANFQQDVVILSYGSGTPLSQAQIDPTTLVITSYPNPTTTYAIGVDYNIAVVSGITYVYIVSGGAIASSTTVQASYNFDINPIPWRCSPQPALNSVVNFYLDTRTQNGEAQLIDSVYIDPLYIGPTCTLYFSNDDTGNLGFAAEATNLVPPVADNVGSLIPTQTGMQWPVSDKAYVAIDNTAIQWDPTQAWWLGFVFQPNYFSNAVTTDSLLWSTDDASGLSFYVQPGEGDFCQLVIETADSKFCAVNVQFSPGATVYAAVAYLPEGTPGFARGMYLFVTTSQAQYAESIAAQGGELVQGTVHPIFDTFSSAGNLFGFYQPTTVVNSYPADIYIGGSPASSSVGNFTLLSAVLKQEVATPAAINAYAQDYATYTYLSPFADVDPTGNTTNALLRFSVQYIEAPNVCGFVGGPGNFYPMLNWTPVLRDFTVKKGTMNLPPTLAKFWKMEFTNLVAQQVNSFVPITQTYQTHQGVVPALVQETNTPLQNNPGEGPVGFETNISTATGNSLVFSDSPQFYQNPAPNPLGAATTAMQTSPDLSVAQGLASGAWYWQYADWHVDNTAPRFVVTGIHNYSTMPLDTTGGVGFFVGLISVSMYALDFGGGTDQVFYDFTFQDETYLDEIGDWVFEPGDLNTVGVSGGDLPVTAQSDVMKTSSLITGIQFGSSQSDAIEIAYDDSFHSGALVGYDWLSTSMAHAVSSSGSSQPSFDSTLQLGYNQNTYSVTVTRNYIPPPAPTVPATPTFGYSNTITATGTHSVSGAFTGIPSTPSNVQIVVGVASLWSVNEHDTTTKTVTDNVGNVYQLLGTSQYDDPLAATDLWVSNGSIAGVTTITVTLASSNGSETIAFAASVGVLNPTWTFNSVDTQDGSATGTGPNPWGDTFSFLDDSTSELVIIAAGWVDAAAQDATWDFPIQTITAGPSASVGINVSLAFQQNPGEEWFMNGTIPSADPAGAVVTANYYNVQMTQGGSLDAIPSAQAPPGGNPDIVRPEVAPIFDMTPPGAGESTEFSGLATAWSSAATEGTIWAAVRLTANTQLSEPLQLQLVDAGSSPDFTPTVLSTTEFTPNAGQTVTEQVGYILGSVIPTGNPIYAQIVQHGATYNNQWTVTQLSIFDEGIIWEFSVDGGVTWSRAFGIRNNPQGLLSFLEPGKNLMWQAIGTREGVHINALRLRPVYQGVV